MPLQDLETRAGLTGAEHVTSGKMVVAYRDAKGNTMNAEVVGPGSTSGLELVIRNRGGGPVVLDDVPAAEDMKDTEVYFDRLNLGG